jgi:excisionase family DNA binding protein
MSVRSPAPNGGAHSLLTQDEAAEYLRVSPRTLERWRLLGIGPRYVKLGGRKVACRLADLDAWINSQLRSSTSDAGGRR